VLAYQVTVVLTTKILKGHPGADRFPAERELPDPQFGWQRVRFIAFASSPQHARDLVESEHREIARQYPVKITRVEPITTSAVYRLNEGESA
jgi:hypothetical protein